MANKAPVLTPEAREKMRIGMEYKRDETVKLPTKHALRQYEDAIKKPVCGTCRFFDYRKGQKQLFEGGVLNKTLKENDWGPTALGGPPEHLGSCVVDKGTHQYTGARHTSCRRHSKC